MAIDNTERIEQLLDELTDPKITDSRATEVEKRIALLQRFERDN